MFLFTSCKEESLEPSAYFVPSATTIKAGNIITFENQSKDAESFDWNFDDGNTSTDYSPVHSYNMPGEYNVLLLAYNKSKNDQYVVLITVETDEQLVESCFVMSPRSPEIGKSIVFTNCSAYAVTYSWDFGDGGTSTSVNPSYVYNKAGSYTVILTANGDTGSNIFQQNITVRGEGELPAFDPYNYNSIPFNGWNPHYYTDFVESESNWGIDPAGELSLDIIDGKYVVKNKNNNDGYLFWAQAALMPSEKVDFDINVSLKIIQDDLLYGVGALWGINEITNEFFYYQLTHFDSEVFQIYGSAYEIWSPGGWNSGGNYGEFNKLTIRKFANKYYFFLNEVFVGENAFEGYYGDYFGFFVGPGAHMEVEDYSIQTMLFNSKKTASEKLKTSTPYIGKGVGAVKIKTDNKLQ
jgi:chitodextrinase